MPDSQGFHCGGKALIFEIIGFVIRDKVMSEKQRYIIRKWVEKLLQGN